MRNTGSCFGNGALKGQATEGGGNEEGQDGDDHLGHDGKYNLLKLLQDLGSGTGVCPGGSRSPTSTEKIRADMTVIMGAISRSKSSSGSSRSPSAADWMDRLGMSVAGPHGHQRGAHRGRIGQD